MPEGAISIVAGGDRDELRQIATQDGVVDLIIPRGGEGLKAALKEHATVPVMYAAAGNCHVFVDASADLDDARRDRRQREGPAPLGLQRGRDAARARRRRRRVPAARARASCASRGWSCAWTAARARWPASSPTRSPDATEEDWATEYHALILAVKVVDSVEEAIEHVNRYGSGHSEAIVTGSTESAQAFTGGVDAACVYVNASTRFTDGGVFGMGAEIGNSTQKLHARGPIGAARAHHLQVRGRGLRAGPRVGARLRVGILGGAFNPPHLGHLVCAQEALVQLELDRVVLVPVGQAPHRELEDDPGAEARLEMVELAIAGDERFAVSRMELDREGPSYTADTLAAAARRESPDDELFLILGGDQAAALPSWHEPEQVLELADGGGRRARWAGRASAIGIKLAPACAAPTACATSTCR